MTQIISSIYALNAIKNIMDTNSGIKMNTWMMSIDVTVVKKQKLLIRRLDIIEKSEYYISLINI